MKKVSVDKWCISIPSSLSISHTAHGFSIVTRLWGMLLALSIGCATKKQHFCLDPIGVLKKSIFQKSVPRKQRLTVGSTLECCFFLSTPLIYFNLLSNHHHHHFKCEESSLSLQCQLHKTPTLSPCLLSHFSWASPPQHPHCCLQWLLRPFSLFSVSCSALHVS